MEGGMKELREAQKVLVDIKEEVLREIIGRYYLNNNSFNDIEVWLVGNGHHAIDKIDIHIQMVVNDEKFYNVTEVCRCNSKEVLWKAIGDGIVQLVTQRVVTLLNENKDAMESLNSLF